MPKWLQFCNFNWILKLIICADFKIILVPEKNGKQIPKGPYTNKYENHIGWGYGYKEVCVDDEFSKVFKTYLDKDVVYNFINNMIEESKYCIEVMDKNFYKELPMTKEDNKDFNNSNKCWICTMIMFITMLN